MVPSRWQVVPPVLGCPLSPRWQWCRHLGALGALLLEAAEQLLERSDRGAHRLGDDTGALDLAGTELTRRHPSTPLTSMV